jgi:hypothetical protein
VRARNRAVVAEGLVWGVEEPAGAASGWVVEKGMAALRERVAGEMREMRERGEGGVDDGEGGFRWCGRACVVAWPAVRGVGHVSDLAAAKAFGAVVKKEEGVKMEEGVKKWEGMEIASEAAAELIKTAVREREYALRCDEMVEKALAGPPEPEVEPLMTPASVRRAPSSAGSSAASLTGATAGGSSVGRAPSVRFSTTRPSKSTPSERPSPAKKTSSARAALEWATSFFASGRAASVTSSSAGASTSRPPRPRSAAARQAALRSRSAIDRDPWVDIRTRIGKETIVEEEEDEANDFMVNAWVADAWLSSVASVVDAEVASPSKSVVRKDSAVDLAAAVEANLLALLERDTIAVVDEEGGDTLIV